MPKLVHASFLGLPGLGEQNPGPNHFFLPKRNIDMCILLENVWTSHHKSDVDHLDQSDICKSSCPRAPPLCFLVILMGLYIGLAICSPQGQTKFMLIFSSYSGKTSLTITLHFGTIPFQVSSGEVARFPLHPHGTKGNEQTAKPWSTTSPNTHLKTALCSTLLHHTTGVLIKSAEVNWNCIELHRIHVPCDFSCQMQSSFIPSYPSEVLSLVKATLGRPTPLSQPPKRTFEPHGDLPVVELLDFASKFQQIEAYCIVSIVIDIQEIYIYISSFDIQFDIIASFPC